MQGTEQHSLKEIIEKYLPKGRGEVFIPCMELYRRGEKEIREVSIFPGYIFLYTGRNIWEIHEMLSGYRAELNSFPRELALRERRMSDRDFLYGEAEDEVLCELSDLDEEETELDILREGGGLFAMFCGYEENRKYYVMGGPLKAFEDKIEKLDKHNRKAFLRFEINGKQARAGFKCKLKTHWFPKKDSRIVKLPDGVEVDLEELVQKVMKI